MKNYIIIGLCFCVALFSCKKENTEIGFDNNDSELGGVKSDTFSIITYNEMPDSIITSGVNSLFSGHYNSSELGDLTAKSYMTLSPVTTDFVSASGTTYDSLELTFKYFSLYGKEIIEFDVYSTTENVESTNTYTNNDSLTLDNLIGTFSLSSSEDSIVRIKLDNTLGNSIFSNLDNIFSSTSGLILTLPGIAIVPKNYSGFINQGKMVGIVAGTINLNIHYHSSTVNYVATALLNSNTDAFTNSVKDINGSSLENVILNPINGNNQVYVQGLNGPRVVLEFPYLEKWFSEGKYLINKAELICPVTLSSNQDFEPVTNIFVHRADQTITNRETGVYDSQSYKLNVSVEIRNYLNDTSATNKDLRISVLNNYLRASQTILNGSENANPMKLVLYYTQY